MHYISKLIKMTRVRAFALALLVFAGLGLASALGMGQTLENQGLDLAFRYRPQTAPPPEIIIVGIDENSFQDLRKAWPWPRRFHAQLIRYLKASGARLIVFDVIFAEPSDPKEDQDFADAILEAGNVILATTIERSENTHVSRQILVQPYAPFRQAALGVGLTLVTPEGDGIVRRFNLRFSEQVNLSEIVARCFFPSLIIPANLSGLINFTGPPGHIPAVSYSRLLLDPEPSLTARFKGKIVFVGRILEASPTPLADAFYTPYFSNTGQLMPGVEILGQVTNTLLKGKWGGELGLLPRLAFYLAVLLFFAFLVGRSSPSGAVAVLAGFIFLLYGLSFLVFLQWNFWVPVVLLSGGLAMVYAGHIFAYYWIESQEKRWLRQAFSHYVSDSLVEAIIAHPDRLQLGGEEVEVTVLFVDLVGFSSLAETTAPRELIRLLNEYFTATTEIILAHKGTVDKFIGDAVMAFWGAPLPLADHAVLGCKAALGIQAAMGRLTEGWGAQGFHRISTRIGLHSGPVIAGNVGSKKRFSYTVMGDTVNLAARLQDANRTYGTEIILSQATRRRLLNAFLIRELDLVQVRGRGQSVTIYELISFLPPDGPPPWLQLFEAGRAAYSVGKIPEAANFFQEILENYLEDMPSRVFLKRCHRHLERPMLEEWKGAFVLDR